MSDKQQMERSSSISKRRKRVNFADVDTGIDPNSCIRIILVNSQDEMTTTNGIQIEPAYIDRFFGEDGKIYGYKNLKIDIWISSVSLLGYAEISYESSCDGGKGITDLKQALQDIFGESLLEKDDFLRKLSTETHCISTAMSEGTVVSSTDLDMENSVTEVVRMDFKTSPAGMLYSRFLPLILLLVEGSTPIDVTDQGCELYFIAKKMHNNSGDYVTHVLGFASTYRFYHYPDSTRLRISQILVLPPYQGNGHGLKLLEAVNCVAIAEDAYDVTVEEPSDHLQYLRACVDTLRLNQFKPVKAAIVSAVLSLKEGELSKKPANLRLNPPSTLIEITRQKLKINKKQFLRCWEVLVFLNLDSVVPTCVDKFRSCVLSRVMGEILEKDEKKNGKRLVELPNKYDHEKAFVMFWSQTGMDRNGFEGELENNGKTQQQQLREIVQKEVEDITAVAKRVSLLSKA